MRRPPASGAVMHWSFPHWRPHQSSVSHTDSHSRGTLNSYIGQKSHRWNTHKPVQDQRSLVKLVLCHCTCTDRSWIIALTGRPDLWIMFNPNQPSFFNMIISLYIILYTIFMTTWDEWTGIWTLIYCLNSETGLGFRVNFSPNDPNVAWNVVAPKLYENGAMY